jgi:hypothetical protein
MSDDSIPQDLQEFILRNLDSVAQLEGLLLLFREPDKTWTSQELAGRLYIRVEEATELLDRLRADGFVSSEGEYSFAPQTVEQQQLVGRLADVYARQLIPITNMIHDKPRRIREFSDAFKIRRDRS